MSPHLEREVRQRALERSEYCLIPESADIIPPQIDHIIARQHDGQATSDNLALACLSCNGHKGPNIAGIDPVTRALTRLYHPRQDRWDEHFGLARDGTILGTTAIGRTSVAVLKMNEFESRLLRSLLIREGVMVPGEVI